MGTSILRMLNMEYLKNCVCRFMTTTEMSEKKRLFPVISTILNFTTSERQQIILALNDMEAGATIDIAASISHSVTSLFEWGQRSSDSAGELWQWSPGDQGEARGQGLGKGDDERECMSLTIGKCKIGEILSTTIQKLHEISPSRHATTAWPRIPPSIHTSPSKSV